MLDEFDGEIKQSGSEADPTYDWRVVDRIYHLTSSVFVKRLCKPEERVRSLSGGIAEYPWNRERLMNERDALIFIATNTTIPVPRVLDWSEEDGAMSLTVTAVKGEAMVDVMRDSTPERRLLLKKNVDDFMYDFLLPQLASLRSRKLGQLSGHAISPPRVLTPDNHFSWKSRTSNVARYVYCHNDLSQQNIMVDPVTLQVTSVIDWEYSGFFHPIFEKHFWHFDYWWLDPDYTRERADAERLQLRELLDEPAELSIKQSFSHSILNLLQPFSRTLSLLRYRLKRLTPRLLTIFRGAFACGAKVLAAILV